MAVDYYLKYNEEFFQNLIKSLGQETGEYLSHAKEGQILLLNVPQTEDSREDSEIFAARVESAGTIENIHTLKLRLISDKSVLQSEGIDIDSFCYYEEFAEIEKVKNFFLQYNSDYRIYGYSEGEEFIIILREAIEGRFKPSPYDGMKYYDIFEKSWIINCAEFERNLESLRKLPIESFISTAVIVRKAFGSDFEMGSKCNQMIDKLMKVVPEFYHPGSANSVLDLVHPSLYCLIDGVSPTVKIQKDEFRKLQNTDFGDGILKSREFNTEFWKRGVESTHQWLPSEFKIDKNGKCSIDSYVNNLPTECESEVIPILEQMFTMILPEFEKMFGLLEKVCFVDENNLDMGKNHEEITEEVAQANLKNKNLQVITKIVRYVGDVEGVWHLEGTDREKIVATAVFVSGQEGVNCDVLMERPLTCTEHERCQEEAVQDSSALNKYAFDYVGKNRHPVGKLCTESDMLFVFPNTHIHKVSVNKVSQEGYRNVVVFWLVDPRERIISTKHIGRQQEKMSREEAEKHMLNLMEERKVAKQNFNWNEVSLCEH